MKFKVLAVDDDPLQLTLIQDIIEAQEWEPYGFATGKEGFDGALAVAPDIILLDVNLPDIQGWDLCRQIRGAPSIAKTPIVLMSGKRKESEDIVKGLQSGADDYLPKPVDPAFLIEKIKTILRNAPRSAAQP